MARRSRLRTRASASLAVMRASQVNSFACPRNAPSLRYADKKRNYANATRKGPAIGDYFPSPEWARGVEGADEKSVDCNDITSSRCNCANCTRQRAPFPVRCTSTRRRALLQVTRFTRPAASQADKGNDPVVLRLKTLA